MKRSEMLALMYGKFTKEHTIKKASIHDALDKLLDYMLEQGMQPPLYDRIGFGLDYENQWEPEITQETIDQNLKAIGKKGLRGKVEITE